MIYVGDSAPRQVFHAPLRGSVNAAAQVVCTSAGGERTRAARAHSSAESVNRRSLLLYLPQEGKANGRIT